jgi:magnesium and cobalt exporter, CNNM family
VQAYIDVGRQEGILEKEEEKLLLSIVDFGDTRVREVMTPRTDIVWIDVASSLTVLADLFVESKYSRIPVVRGSIDTIVGIVHVKDTLQSIRAGGSRPIAELVREAYFVPETKKVSELLKEFQRRHLWMAVVVDEYGGVSGLATVEDLLEEIVGEISDEHEDEREEISRLGDQAYSVSGKANITKVEELFGRGPEEEEYTTLGGFLAARLGHIPRPGEVHREADLLFTVEEADRRRVHRVRIEPAAVPVPRES